MWGNTGTTLAVVCGLDCPANLGARKMWGLVAFRWDAGSALAVLCGLDCPAKTQSKLWTAVVRLAGVRLVWDVSSGGSVPEGV